MELPPDVGTDDEEVFCLPCGQTELELPPDIDTEAEDDGCAAIGKKERRGCSCNRNCFSHIDDAITAEIRGKCTGLSEVEQVQRRWNLIRSLCCDADGAVKLFSKMKYTICGIEVPIRHSPRHGIIYMPFLVKPFLVSTL